jgi:hypothetical protein
MESILRQANLSEMERLALSTLCERIHCAESLAESLGAKHFIVVNKLVGSAGRKLFEASPSDSIVRSWCIEESGWYRVIAPGFRSVQDKKFYWEIRPEWKHACMSLGWYADLKSLDGDSDIQVRYEGNEVLRLITAYERDPKLREECLRIRGFNCLACEINMGDIYGHLGEGFIHVHHVVPLHHSKKRETNPSTDLIPLCPNCHCIIHRGGRTLSVEALKDALKANKTVLDNS